MSESLRPLLLLDVDGPLNPYAGGREYLEDRGYTRSAIHGFSVWLDKKIGPRLLAFAEETGTELVWATTWEHHANQQIGPRIHLPELPVIEFPRKFSGVFRDDHWKFDAVLEYAGDRPLAWFDDDFDRFDEDQIWFIEQRGDRPTWLQVVDPALGLTSRDFGAVQAWATGLRAHNAATAAQIEE